MIQTLQELASGLREGGDSAALITFEEDEARTQSYRELATAVERCASRFIADDIRSGERVVICASPSRPWIVAFLALLRCGACPVPADTQFPEETLLHVLQDSDCRLVLANASTAERMAGACETADVAIRRLEALDADERTTAAADQSEELPAVAPHDLAILFYTSGTTGPPKGVPLTHQNILHQIDFLTDSRLVTKGDRVMLPLPLHHVYPLVIGLLVPLALQLTVILPDGFTGPRILRALRVGDATLMIGVPRLYDAILAGISDQLARQDLLRRTTFTTVMVLLRFLRRRLGWRLGKTIFRALHRRIGPSLRTVVSGGSALKPETAWELETLGWQVGTGYGLTETSPLLTMKPPGDDRFETAGKPIRGIELRIGQDTTGTDENGDVQVCGPGVFEGYNGLPDKAAESFTEDGWFRTGDLGHLDADGYLHLAGRKSTMIVTESGENVQPEQIEEQFAAHPAIAEIAVFQAEKGIRGLIVPNSGLRRDSDVEKVVREAVRDVSRILPSYQRLADYRITGEAIPRTHLGKPRRHLIEERYRRAGDEPETVDTEAARPVSLDELSADDRSLLDNERAYAVFQLLTDHFKSRRVVPDTDLQLDLGIDSIDWLNLSLEMSERTGITLAEDAVAGISTVRDLLEQVSEGDDGGITVETALESPEGALDDRQRAWLDPPGRLLSLVGYGLKTINGPVMRLFFGLTVRGKENLPASGPFVLAPNHASYLDPLALAAALGASGLKGTYWAGWTGILFNNPARRAFARATNVLPIDPVGAAASSLAFGGLVLERGSKLVWFPEGGRSPDGTLQRFRRGIGLLLAHRQVPVVPVAIRGTHDAWPPSRRLPKRSPVSVTFLPPLRPESIAEKSDKNAADRIAEALFKKIEEFLDDKRQEGTPPSS